MTHYSIEEFIEQSNACTSREQAFALYRKAIGKFGYTSAVYTFVTSHRDAGQGAGHGVQCNFPDDWMQHYISQNYQPVDPVILRVHETATAFTWRDMEERCPLTERQNIILNEAREAGLHDGVGIPLHGPRGELAGTGLASGTPGINPTALMLSQLQWITQQFHLVYCALGDNALPVRRKRMTEREKEILRWLAIGKTDPEIAMILNCSQETVRWHIKNIFRKLEANSKMLAVTKAIHQGIIALDLVSAA